MAFSRGFKGSEMAKVFVNGAGVAIAFRRDAAEETKDGAPSATFYEFDEDTNVALVNEIARDLTPFTVVAGVLRRNGSNVSPAADGDRTGLRRAAAAAIQANADYLALASPTNAQTLAQVRELTRQNNRIIRRILQLS